MKRFSIVVPVYNVGRYLNECIQSIVSQTYEDWELILVDDGSLDQSGTICDQWAQRDARIQVIHQANSGASAARNNGLDHCSGQYILFLDGDDYWIDNNVLAQLSQRIAQTHPDVVVFNYQKDFGGKRVAPYFLESLKMPVNMNDEESARFIAQHELWTACAWNKAIRASLFGDNQLRFRQGTTSEDIDWSLRLALTATRFDYLALSIVNYRQRLTSVTGSMDVHKAQQLLRNVQYCMNLLSQSENATVWRSYVAFQYGTLLYNIVLMGASPEKKQITMEAKAMRHVLKWSANSKLRLLHIVEKVVGFHMMLCLLKMKASKDASQTKRSD